MAEKHIRMLVVEDNPADALLVRKALTEAGPNPFQMEHITRLDAAAKRLAEKGVDVILLDLSLPDEQGLETVRRVQAAAPSLPIVVLTGMDDEAIALEAVRNGAQDYLRKGLFDGASLARSIRYAIERKRAQEELRKLTAELEQRVADRTAELSAANKELEAFCYSIAHDLRTPLRGIEGWCEVLIELYSPSLDDRGNAYLRRARDEAQRMAELIDDLLNLARVTHSEMRSEQVDLSALARTIASALQQTDPERKVEFVIALGMVANGDPNLLRVVLENLLANAWKFTSKHPTARIEFNQTPIEGKAAYYVRDDGAGFDMTYVHKLFAPFQRLHKLTQFPGMGVGLATVQRIIQRHGGRVWAKGQVEKGATIYFTLN